MTGLSAENQRLIETVRKVMPFVRYVPGGSKLNDDIVAARTALDAIAAKLARLEKLEEKLEKYGQVIVAAREEETA